MPHSLLQNQRQFFNIGTTKDVDFRIAQLKALRQAIQAHESEILTALKADLHKSTGEAYLSELLVLKEIDYALKHIRQWAKPLRISTPLEQLPGRSRIYPEPLGVVLIMGAWNYPFQLMMAPLVGAIAAGNCAILKPSEIAPHTSRVVADVISKTFDPQYVTVMEGGAEVSQALLEEKFDHILFTGSAAIGKLVMAAAAKHLTPVTLELGGKSPCIVDRDIHLEHTARRIIWGKFLNAGQTCVAPDYLLVQKNVKADLIQAMQIVIREFYGDDPSQCEDYVRIISDRHFERLVQFLGDGRVVIGGDKNPSDRYLAPTVMDQVPLDAALMQEEIFGPILPVVEYEDLEEAIALINARPKPLALYIFSRSQQIQNRILKETSSGGAAINDTVMQFGVSALPFGGVGDSGIGQYHGKASFDTFSHYKSVLYKPFWLDIKLRYAPYKGKLGLLKKIIGW
ncbi:MAG TPA: aldehyde dehydrogenase [Crinalium sp.]